MERSTGNRHQIFFYDFILNTFIQTSKIIEYKIQRRIEGNRQLGFTQDIIVPGSNKFNNK